MVAKPINILYGLLTVVAAAAGGAWYAGSKIESPAEIAARAAPPAPSVILVPVEERVLSSDVVTRGTVRFGVPQPVSLAPSPLKGNAGLITSLPLRNTQVQEGDVLLTVSGRPVFVLQGDVPAYRDLVPGISGNDIQQLEHALRRLGFDPGPVDGTYDQQTSAAVAKFYAARGWEAFGPTRDQLAAIRALEREWGDAVRLKAAAVASVGTAGVAVEAARAAAEHAVRVAALESASRVADDHKAAEGQKSAVTLTVETERAKAEHANVAADADVAAQIADRSIIVLDPRQTETARASATAKLEVARAARERIRLEGELAVQAAEREARLASGRSQVARMAERSARLEGERNIRAALDAQAAAVLDARLATEREAQITAELDAAKRRLGMQVPIDELVFLRSLPVRVEEITAALGGTATGSLLTVTDNQLAIDSSVPLDAGPLIKPGMRVTIDEQTLGVKATGTVDSIAGSPGTRGVDGFHFYMRVLVDSAPARMEGVSVRLTIPVVSTKGAVTAVPVSAVSLATDGTSRVQVRNGDALEYIVVRPGLSANGYVEVSAVGGRLVPGQLVAVGYGNAAGRDAR